MWNPWIHFRLAGSVAMIVGAVTNNLLVSLLGFFIQYLGIVGGIDALERWVKALEPKEEDNERN